MGKFISNLFLGALALGLSIFTGSRTLDLLAWALPQGQVIYQWLGLAAFELGMYFWSFYFINGAKGTPQRSISVIMAVFSIVAVAIATVADLSLDAGQSGKVAPLSPAMQQAMIVFLGVTIAVNVAAFLACKLLSIENLRNIKEGQAEDLIYDEGLRAVSALAPSMAADAAPHLATEWANRTWQKIVPGVQRETRYLGPASAPVPALAPAPAPAPTAPVVVPSQAPTKPRKLLGFIPLGGSNQAAPATLAQTAPVPAAPAPDAPSEKTSNQIYREEVRARRRAAAPASSVAAARRARRAARMRLAPAVQVAPVPEPAAPAPAPVPAPAAGGAGKKGGARSKK